MESSKAQIDTRASGTAVSAFPTAVLGLSAQTSRQKWRGTYDVRRRLWKSCPRLFLRNLGLLEEAVRASYFPRSEIQLLT